MTMGAAEEKVACRSRLQHVLHIICDLGLARPSVAQHSGGLESVTKIKFACLSVHAREWLFRHRVSYSMFGSCATQWECRKSSLSDEVTLQDDMCK